MPERRGRLVLLNGPSSAGKTTLSADVVRLLPDPCLVLPGDLFHAVRSLPARELSDAEWQGVLRRTRAAYHRALAGAVAAGCDVIADHVLSEPWRLADLLELTEGLDVLLVHVVCDLDELDARESTRGDREPGTARGQAALVFVHEDCDLTVDTTSGTQDAAARVVALLAGPPTSRAFDRLRARLLGPAAGAG